MKRFLLFIMLCVFISGCDLLIFAGCGVQNISGNNPSPNEYKNKIYLKYKINNIQYEIVANQSCTVTGTVCNAGDADIQWKSELTGEIPAHIETYKGVSYVLLAGKKEKGLWFSPPSCRENFSLSEGGPPLITETEITSLGVYSSAIVPASIIEHYHVEILEIIINGSNVYQAGKNQPKHGIYEKNT